MKSIDQPAQVQEAEESELCISCLEPNTPGTHFCTHCGTPLTSYASTAPFESCFAQGDFLRKAATHGRWHGVVRGVVIGLILFMLASLCLGLWAV